MRAPQKRQRPRRTMYETSGRLSYHAISEPQVTHAERGRTSERRSGRRAATTFRKLPSASAGAKAAAARATSIASPIGRTPDRLDSRLADVLAGFWGAGRRRGKRTGARQYS